jgi:WD40 repeat protein
MHRTQASPLLERRREVLRGGFYPKDEFDVDTDYKLWRAPRWRLMIFVSSTFTDTQEERNVLLEKIQPKLRESAREHGIEVTLVDMRWGIRDEITLDHGTWTECRKGIERCEEDSTGLFFLSLQSDKYGYMPLPKYVSEEDFSCRLSRCENEEAKQLAIMWYTLDTNALPARYVLRNLENRKDKEYWNVVLPALRSFLSGVCIDPLLDELRVDMSVTEWEAKFALRKKVNLDRCLWMHRSFEGGVTTEQDAKMLLYDAHDPTVRRKLDDLKSWMNSRLGRAAEKKITVKSYLNRDPEWNAYLTQWEQDVERNLATELEKIKQHKSMWAQDGEDLGLPGEILEDIFHHYGWAYGKCASFIGRDQLLSECLESVHGTSSIQNKYGVCLAIVASSGTGKTALMAKLAQLLNLEEQRLSAIEPERKRRTVIVRFCGTSRESKTGLDLVRSVCFHLLYLMKTHVDRQMEPIPDEVPGKFDKAVELLHRLLQIYPVILIVDSLDQLTDSTQARSQIQFLKGLRPHRDARIIVSTLPDDIGTGEDKYFYGCATRLQEANIPCITIPAPESWSRDSVAIHIDMMKAMLRRKQRQLTPDQWNIVTSSVAPEPTVLYMSLAIRVIAEWKSYDQPSQLRLMPTVRQLISQVLESVEILHGAKLVRMALAMITFSVEGISDNEMEDLLSLDESVLDELFQYHVPTTRRLPSHVWVRIRDVLTGLIVEHDHGCVVWYHRQLLETAEVRYISEKRQSQVLMARYFGNLISAGERALKKISPQPLLFSATSVWRREAVINVRRCLESSTHLVGSEMLQEAADEMCNHENICAIVKCGEGFRLTKNIVALNELIKSCETIAQDVRDRVYHYMRWLRQCMSTIVQKPAWLLPASCTTTQPVKSLARQDLEAYLQRCQQTSGVNTRSFDASNIFAVALGGNVEFNAIVCTLEGHSGIVLAVAWSCDGKRIASGSTDGTVRIWNPNSGEALLVLEGHSDSVIDVSWSHSGSKLASISLDKTLRIWNASSGSLLVRTELDWGTVETILWNDDDSRLALKTHRDVLSIVESTNGALALQFNCSEICANDNDNSRLTVIWEDEAFRLYKARTRILLESTVNGTIVEIESPNSGVIRVWDSRNGALLSTFDHKSMVEKATSSNDGMKIASRGEDGHLRIWDAASGQELLKLEGHHVDECIRSGVWNPDNRRVAGSTDKWIRIWDTSVGVAVTPPSVHLGTVMCISWNPDATHLASGSTDKTIMIWNSLTGQRHMILEGHTATVNCVSWSFDGKRIVSGSDDATMLIWDALSGIQLRSIVHPYSVVAVGWSICNDKVVSASADGTTRLWDADTYLLLGSFDGERCMRDNTAVAAWSPDGKLIASSASGSLELFDSKTAQPLQRLGTFVTYCWSPDSGLIVAGNLTTVQIFDVESGEPNLILDTSVPPGMCIDSLCWSPDGERIVGSFINPYSIDAVIFIWEASTGARLASLPSHSGHVHSARWSPDGRRFATGTSDGRVRIWSSW